MNDLLERIQKCRALVIGDVILDRYLEGDVERISPEAPVPVVATRRERSRPGGASNVAAGIAALGGGAHLAGVLGDDEEGGRLLDEVRAAGVKDNLMFRQPGSRTICKTRVVGPSGQQLLRIDQNGDRIERERSAAELLRRVVREIGQHDVVVLSDYCLGTCPPEFSRVVVGECCRLGIPCIVDSKRPDLEPFAGATALTPNVAEVERVVGRPLNQSRDVASAARELKDSLDLGFALITQGSEGMTLALGSDSFHLPAEVREVADVTGAGDTVTATVAVLIAVGVEVREACRLANVAAGIAVSRRGTTVVTAAELLGARSGRSPKVVEIEYARERIARKRQEGRKVVFTNGCFDLLHAGHLSCLERARALGGLLVVGLNSDESVRGLKGEGRPIVSQEHRAALLAGLTCVDMVVIFDESTPEELRAPA